MEPQRPNVRPAVLLSVVGFLVVAVRLILWFRTQTATWERPILPRTVGEWCLASGILALAAVLSALTAFVAKRRLNPILAVLLATAFGGVSTGWYNAAPGAALGAAIGLSAIVRRAVQVLLKICALCAVVFAAGLFGVLGGIAVLFFTGNPGDGWHGPMAWSMLTLACIAGSLFAWRAWRGGARRRWLRCMGHCVLLVFVLAGQWLSLSVDTLRRVWWLGTPQTLDIDVVLTNSYPARRLCLMPFDESWLYRGCIGVEQFAGGPRVDDREMATIGGWQELTHLELRGAAVTDKGMKHVGRLNGLGAIGLRDTPIGDEGLKVLATLPRLRELDLRRTQVTDDGLAHLPSQTGLWALHLDGTRITDNGLKNLQGLTQLRALGLSGTQVAGDGLKHLKTLPMLTYLNLADTAVTNDGLAQLGLNDEPIWRGQLGFFAIDLSGTRVTERGVEYLAGATQLKLARTQITDKGLRQLARLDGLRGLDLSDTQVTDAGLVHLKPLVSLYVLELAGTRVTAAGVVELAGCLGGLKHVDLRRCGLTKDELRELRKKLPDVSIYAESY